MKKNTSHYQRLLVNTIKRKKSNIRNRDIKKALHELKNEVNTSIFETNFNQVVAHKLTNGYITGNLFPKDITEMSAYLTTEGSNSLLYELRWWLKTFQIHTVKINDFIVLRKKTEDAILKSNWIESLSLLDETKCNFGVSLWYFEKLYFINNYLNSDEKVIIKPDDCKNPQIRTLLSFYEVKSKEDLRYDEYDYYIIDSLESFTKNNPESIDLGYFYFYELSPLSCKRDLNSIKHASKYYSQATLIDAYIYFIGILDYFETESNERDILIEYLNTYLPEVKDINLARYIAIPTLEQMSHLLNIDLFHIEHLYCENKVSEAINFAKSTLSQNIDIEVVELLATISLLEDISIFEQEDNLFIHDIYRLLKSVVSFDYDYEDSLVKLMKIIYMNKSASWCNILFSFISKHTHHTKDSIPHSHLTSRSRLLEQINQYTLLNEIQIPAGNPPYAYERISKIIEMKKHKFNIADLYNRSTSLNIRYYEPLIELSVINSILFDAVLDGFKLTNLICLFSSCTPTSADIEQSLSIIFRVHLFNSSMMKIIPSKAYLKLLNGGLNYDRSNIIIPIFYMLNLNKFGDNYDIELSMVCEDFLNEIAVSKPSELLESDKHFVAEELEYFLEEVCIPSVIESCVIDFVSSYDVDVERIEICQQLIRSNPNKMIKLSEEIKQITEKLMIKEGIQHIEDSKIFVNVQGIRGRLSKEIESDYQRYLMYKNKDFDIVQFVEEKLEDNTFQFYITPNKQATKLFNELVIKVRNYFVSSNEYGLDGYLSLNIRHGTLADELRAPFVRERIFIVDTDRDTHSVDYTKSKWYLKIKDKKVRDKTLEVLMRFTTETEEIIKYLKSELIQISTETKKTSGVFDFNITRISQTSIESSLNANSDLDDFLNLVVEALWDITDESMIKMRQIISGEIDVKYQSAISHLLSEINKLGHKIETAEIKSAIAKSAEETQNQLMKMQNWFKRPNTEYTNEFSLDLAFNIGSKIIENIHPNINFDLVEVEKNIPVLISGNKLKSYVDIFYTLFDNISKYATCKNDSINVRYKLISTHDKLSLHLENDFDCSGDMTEHNEEIIKIDQMIKSKKYLKKVKLEGGTGIPKVCKLIAVDLNYNSNIDLGYNSDNNTYHITLDLWEEKCEYTSS